MFGRFALFTVWAVVRTSRVYGTSGRLNKYRSPIKQTSMFSLGTAGFPFMRSGGHGSPAKNTHEEHHVAEATRATVKIISDSRDTLPETLDWLCFEAFWI